MVRNALFGSCLTKEVRDHVRACLPLVITVTFVQYKHYEGATQLIRKPEVGGI